MGIRAKCNGCAQTAPVPSTAPADLPPGWITYGIHHFCPNCWRLMETPPTQEPTSLERALAAELMRLASEPLSPASLVRIEQFAKAARAMLALGANRVQGALEGVPQLANTGPEWDADEVMPPIALGPTFAGSAPNENFGGKVVRDLPALFKALAGINDTPERLVNALAAAREHGLDDVAAALEQRLGVKRVTAAIDDPAGAMEQRAAAQNSPDNISLAGLPTQPTLADTALPIMTEAELKQDRSWWVRDSIGGAPLPLEQRPWHAIAPFSKFPAAGVDARCGARIHRVTTAITYAPAGIGEGGDKEPVCEDCVIRVTTADAVESMLGRLDRMADLSSQIDKPPVEPPRDADPSWPFPWRKPISHYDTNGPAEPLVFKLYGVSFRVKPTDKTGIDTGRTRFETLCLTCKEGLLHPATTSPSHYIMDHLVDKHGVSRDVFMPPAPAAAQPDPAPRDAKP